MSSLSRVADNLAEGLQNSKCKDNQSCLEFVEAKDKILMLKCLKCNKSHKKYFNKDLVKGCPNTCKFCDGDINKFCLMLKKWSLPF